jgi:site-specific recombinase XerD
VRVYQFDREACAGLPQEPVVGIHPGMPFVLDHDGHPVTALNLWLRSLPTTGVPAPKSWLAYAGDVVAWLRFLGQRDVGLFDEVIVLRDALAAYHAERRMGELDRRLAPASWNRAVAAIARFYDWAHDQGLVEAVPFRYRSRLASTEARGPVVVRQNLAKERQGRPGAGIRWLEADYLELFLSTGLAGRLPDGTDDEAFRGRQGARNHAMGRLAATSGLRAQEFSHLLVWELPALVPGDDAEVVELAVPAAIAKGAKARTTWVATAALSELWAYLALERAGAVAGAAWRPRAAPLLVSEADAVGGTVNGRRLRWTALGPAERRRLVAPGGGSALLAVRSDGGPMIDWEHTFAAASRRCRRFDARFPAVTPHVLRHCFAVHVLRALVRSQLADVARLGRVAGQDPAWALALRAQDPLLVLRDLLGHASVSTTEVYLRTVDLTRLFTDAELAAGGRA